MDSEISKLKEEKRLLSEEVRSMEQALNELKSSLTLEQIIQKINSLSEENMKLEKRLVSLRNGEKVDPKEKERVEKRLKEYSTLWKTRKRQVSYFN